MPCLLGTPSVHPWAPSWALPVQPPLAPPPGSAAQGWVCGMGSSCLCAHNLWHFLSSFWIHYKDMYSLLHCIAPPVGLGKNCPGRLAYKVCYFRASIRHTLPCSKCKHSTQSLPSVEVMTPLAPPALSCPHSTPLDGLVSHRTPDPSSWLGAGSPVRLHTELSLGPEDEDQPLVGVGGQVPPVPRKQLSHPDLPLDS